MVAFGYRLLLVGFTSLGVVCSLLYSGRWSLFVVSCFLRLLVFVVYCLVFLFVVWCLVFGVLVLGVCSFLVVACCSLLFVVVRLCSLLDEC